MKAGLFRKCVKSVAAETGFCPLTTSGSMNGIRMIIKTTPEIECRVIGKPNVGMFTFVSTDGLLVGSASVYEDDPNLFEISTTNPVSAVRNDYADIEIFLDNGDRLCFDPMSLEFGYTVNDIEYTFSDPVSDGDLLKTTDGNVVKVAVSECNAQQSMFVFISQSDDKMDGWVSTNKFGFIRPGRICMIDVVDINGFICHLKEPLYAALKA